MRDGYFDTGGGDTSFRIRDLLREAGYRRVIVKEDLDEMQWKAFCLSKIKKAILRVAPMEL